MSSLRVIILAAGKGTRMKSRVPKVLHGLCGRSLIEHSLTLVRSLGAKAYVVLGHQADVVKAHLGPGAVAVRQRRLLGTADAVKSVGPLMAGYSGDVLVVCADTPLLRKKTLEALVRRHRASRASATILTAKVREPFGYGRIIRDGRGQVAEIREEKDLDAREKKIPEINSGVYCFKARDLFDGLRAVRLNPRKKEYYLTDIIGILRSRKKTIAAVTLEDSREALGINDREQLSFLGGLLRQTILKKLMKEGVTIEDPATTYVDVDVKIGSDTIIRPCVVIEKNVVIGKDCVIGPFCHLRPGTRLKDGVQIGNFAEVSRSTVDKGTLMKHFSFLGDARVGKKVNIGAGVVTANYDGKNKNATRIDDGAFIGSDSILVAPVAIGRKAMTGAGCVVTKGKKVPAGAVAMGVPAKIKTKG